jgi:hypothetical protein
MDNLVTLIFGLKHLYRIGAFLGLATLLLLIPTLIPNNSIKLFGLIPLNATLFAATSFGLAGLFTILEVWHLLTSDYGRALSGYCACAFEFKQNQIERAVNRLQLATDLRIVDDIVLVTPSSDRAEWENLRKEEFAYIDRIIDPKNDILQVTDQLKSRMEIHLACVRADGHRHRYKFSGFGYVEDQILFTRKKTNRYISLLLVHGDDTENRLEFRNIYELLKFRLWGAHLCLRIEQKYIPHEGTNKETIFFYLIMRVRYSLTRDLLVDGPGIVVSAMRNSHVGIVTASTADILLTR